MTSKLLFWGVTNNDFSTCWQMCRNVAKFPIRCREHLIKTWKFTALLLAQPQSLRKLLGKLQSVWGKQRECVNCLQGGQEWGLMFRDVTGSFLRAGDSCFPMIYNCVVHFMFLIPKSRMYRTAHFLKVSWNSIADDRSWCCAWSSSMLPSNTNQVPLTRTSKQVTALHTQVSPVEPAESFDLIWSIPLAAVSLPGLHTRWSFASQPGLTCSPVLGAPSAMDDVSWIFPGWRRGWIFPSWSVWELRPASSSFKEKELLFSEVMGHQLLTPGSGCTGSWMGIPGEWWCLGCFLSFAFLLAVLHSQLWKTPSKLQGCAGVNLGILVSLYFPRCVTGDLHLPCCQSFNPDWRR